jgi:hypothetical protein
MAIPTIRRGVTFARDAATVARELRAALGQPAMVLVVVFMSSDRDLPALAAALKAAFAPVPVIGCTTAGEITPEGYREGSVTGLSLAMPDFVAAPVLIRDLPLFNVGGGRAVLRQAVQTIMARVPQLRRENLFAFTLIDGVSGCEEAIVSALHMAMAELPLAGGSAGDGLRFGRTYVLHDGQVYTDAALFVLVATRLPFCVFKTEHYTAGTERVVITEADPARRIVREINAEPAAEEYARVVGFGGHPLTPKVFANHPLVVRVGGVNFVRSIQKVNEDGSLTFYCAIDEGIVLTKAEGVDLAANLERLFRTLRRDLGEPALVLGFDCILRGLEMDEKGIRGPVERMMLDNNVLGFATYGEQYQAMHVNQTFTGVAIGAAGRA